MRYSEAIEKIKSGDLLILNKGHNCNDFLKHFENSLEIGKRLKARLIEEIKEGHERKDFKQGIVDECDKEQVEGEPFSYNFTRESEHYCFNCGVRISPFFFNNGIRFIPHLKYYDILENHSKEEGLKHKWDSVIRKTDNFKCSFGKETGKGDSMDVELDFPSGIVSFRNFFKGAFNEHEDTLGKYDGYDLGAYGGRYNIMKAKAKIGLGYGQMCNTSVCVFVSDCGEKIKLANDYNYDEVTDTEDEISFDGFQNYGKISLNCWRYEFCDTQILKEKGFLAISKLTKPSDGYEDDITVKVKSGRWRLKHFYDLNGWGENNVAAEIELIK